MAMHKIRSSQFLQFSVLFLLFHLAFWNHQPVQAQILPGQSQTPQPEVPEFPEDSLGRRSPRGTVNGLVRAVASQDYLTASRYLNLRDNLQDEQERIRLVRVLQRLLDQGGSLLPYSRISDQQTGRTEDDLPPGLDRVGTVSVDTEAFDILVEETTGSEGGPIWLIASETIENIAAVDFEYSLLAERIIPDFLKGITWGGVSAGQWILIVLLILISLALAWFLTWVLILFLRLIWKGSRNESNAGIIKAFLLPIRLYAAVWLFVVFTQELGISILVRQRLNETIIVIGVFALLLLFWRLNEFITTYSQRKMIERDQPSGLSIVLFLRRLFKVIIFVIGFIAVLGAVGVDVTAGIAALGIGGLALALGAQKSIENFVGSVTLIADRPLRVGDTCRIGDTFGTVENIGMRSTMIRTLDRTVVTIPNGELSSTKIENLAHRDRFLFHPVFSMRYETTANQMRYLLIELRSVLYAHPKVDPEPARVRFAEFGDASLNIEIFSYVLAKDFNDFVEIREDLLLRMMDVVEKSGTGFAFPSQTIYLAKDQGLSKEKTENAEQEIRNRKEKGDLPIPKFSQDQINSLKNSASYPPKGSVKGNDEVKP